MTEKPKNDRNRARHLQSSGRKAPKRFKEESGGQRVPKKTGRKRWGKLRPRDLLILAVPAIAVGIAAVLIFFFTQGATSYALEGQACQYYGGSTYRIQEGSVLRRTSDSETVLETGERQETLTSLPVYFEDRQVVTLPQDMVYYAPRTGERGRAEFFSEISFRSGGAVKLTRDGAERALSAGFLFDGEDFYLFLEPVTLTFNGYEMELPAMSYVEAVYSGDIMVFNYDTKEFIMEVPEGNVTASAGGGDYTVALLGDSMTDHEGNRTLLVTKPDLLDPIL